ncbi:hypothetical protein GJ698_03220 [Pseudoduganella sp. FT26W]|uniref:Uncharacterized protein n=1 Tax=Duganella aquatilis TaxID=2666082 RepID=A0A844CWF8_9BURK|nr:hypothetical protein [Duganella aquatilis]MRW83101.1 hypothetical protein [Duganella aquatilis]
MHFWQWLNFIIVLLVFGAYLVGKLRLVALRRAGRYPMPGQAVMADVERLLKSGERSWAIRCYCEIHACSLRQARDAVAALVKQ